MGNIDMVVAPVGDDPAGILVPPAKNAVRSLPAIVVHRRLALVQVPVELRGTGCVAKGPPLVEKYGSATQTC